MSLLWTGYSDLATQYLTKAPMFTAAATVLCFAVLASWNSGVMGAEWYIYLSTLVFLFMSLCTAAYLAVKTVDAAVAFTEGFAYIYRSDSALGNALGFWEAVFTTGFLMWSLGITWHAFHISEQILDTVQAREYAVYHEGTFGHAVDTLEAIKMSTLLFVMAIGIWISGFAIADNADELLDWFNHYDDDTDNEADTKQNSIVDEDGTSIFYDFIYHTVLIVGVDFLYSIVTLGGEYMWDTFGKFKEVQNCDLGDYSSSTYNGFVDQIQNIPQGTYAECLSTIDNIVRAMDLNSDGIVDRCENAKFLKGIGNTDEYAANYSGSVSLVQAQEICKYYVIDAFESAEAPDTSLMTLLIQTANGLFPFELLGLESDSYGMLKMRPMSLK